MNDNKQPTNLNNTEVVNNDKREMKVENNNNSFIRFLKKSAVQSIIASLLCAIIGLFIGYLVLLIIKPGQANKNFINLIKGFMYSSNKQRRLKYLGTTLTKTAPLILTGLSVLFAYKAGLFNIGAAGQYTMGVVTALYCALVLNLPWYISTLLATIVGGIWGSLTGILKAYLNVNEVISSIMLNWIGLYLGNLIMDNPASWDSVKSETWSLFDAKHANASVRLPNLGLDKVFGGNQYVGIGVIIAIVVAIIIYIVLNKTTFGYELKATGFNRNAAKYSGMHEKRNIILTMAIAGGLAGLSGATLYLTGIMPWYNPANLPSMGFDGISAAFLGGLNPFGTIISSFFITFIIEGGGNLDTTYYSPEIATLITSIIIYLCAFVLFIKTFITKRVNKKIEQTDKKEEK